MDLQDLLTFVANAQNQMVRMVRVVRMVRLFQKSKSKLRAYAATRLENGSPSLAEQFIDVSVTHPFDSLSHISLDKILRNLDY